jgi:hypothetical protein
LIGDYGIGLVPLSNREGNRIRRVQTAEFLLPQAKLSCERIWSDVRPDRLGWNRPRVGREQGWADAGNRLIAGLPKQRLRGIFG